MISCWRVLCAYVLNKSRAAFSKLRGGNKIWKYNKFNESTTTANKRQSGRVGIVRKLFSVIWLQMWFDVRSEAFSLFVSSHHGVCFTTGASVSAPQTQWRQRHTCGRSFYSPSTPGASQRKRRQPKEPKPKIKNIHVNEFSPNLLNSLFMHLFFLVWIVHRWRA